YDVSVGGSGVSFRFFFSSRRRHTRFSRDWSSDVCSSDLSKRPRGRGYPPGGEQRTSSKSRLKKNFFPRIFEVSSKLASFLGAPHGGARVGRASSFGQPPTPSPSSSCGTLCRGPEGWTASGCHRGRCDQRPGFSYRSCTPGTQTRLF